MWRLTLVLSAVLVTIVCGVPVAPKGLLDTLFYDDTSSALDDSPLDYDVIYDTRQKGEENYRIHINGVYVAVPADSGSMNLNQDLLEAIESMYPGSAASGSTEEVIFNFGSSTEAALQPDKKPENEITNSEIQSSPEKPVEKPTIVVVEEGPQEPIQKPEASIRNSDIIVLQKERPSSRKR